MDFVGVEGTRMEQGWVSVGEGLVLTCPHLISFTCSSLSLSASRKGQQSSKISCNQRRVFCSAL